MGLPSGRRVEQHPVVGIDQGAGGDQKQAARRQGRVIGQLSAIKGSRPLLVIRTTASTRKAGACSELPGQAGNEKVAVHRVAP